ncbi:endonuclease/exonuclease/phosphatase family protein [Nonomuraea sp. NPDC059194]|uniref:endonuclease/exonuclease/phosphatase family protein n=1 Tax=Nonomuraea sp. NPDC059194 TaxID=3346764 RepID=UPI0036C4515C
MIRTVLAWLLVVPFAVWATLRVTGVDLADRWIQLVAFTPYVAAASVVPLLAAGLLRRWAPLAVAVVTAGALALAVLPRYFTDADPATGDRTFKVLAANLAVGAGDTAELVKLVERLQPDVLAIQELTPDAMKKLDALGLRERMPYRVDRSHTGVWGSGIYSLHPLTEKPLLALGNFRQARAAVKVKGGPEIEVVSVHPCAPSSTAKMACWRSGLAALPRAGGQLKVLAGDFNATLDHWPVRDLLRSGYRDAADVTGQGFTATWPQQGWRPVPGVTIDHVLADARMGVRSFSVHPLSSTDHRPVFAELTLP